MANIVDAQSAEFEATGTGVWAAWFNCTIAKTTEAANQGTGSLRVACEDAFVGLSSNNWPGSTGGVVAGHEYAISFAAEGPAATWTLEVHWRDDAGTNLATASVPITTAGAGTWAQSDVVLSTSPAATTRYYFELETATAAAGEVHHLDSFVIDDAPSSSTITWAWPPRPGIVAVTRAASGGVVSVERVATGAMSVERVATATVTVEPELPA